MNRIINRQVSSVSVVVATLIAGIGFSANANAANITFSAPVAITTANATLAVDTHVVGAATFDAAPITVTTASHPGGIVFTNDNSVAKVLAANGETAQALTGPLTGNTNFDSVLNNFAYDGSPTTVQLQGLTIGTTYEVQLFAVDDRSVPAERTVAFSDGTNQSQQFLEGSNVYVTGLFTANATTQNIESIGFGYPGNPADTGSNINALVLNVVPEPASLVALAGLAGMGLIALAYRRRQAV